MILLTPFLTVLRVSREDGAIIHAPLAALDEAAFDMQVEAPRPLPHAVAIQGLPGAVLVPGSRPGLVRINRSGEDLRVARRLPRAFLQPGGGSFELLLATDAELAALRRLAASAWETGPADTPEEITFVPAEHFRLDGGALSCDLVSHMPVAVPPDGMAVRAEDGATLTLRPRGPARDEILLRRAPLGSQPQRAGSEADFRATSNRMFGLVHEDESLALPLTVSMADRAWLNRRRSTGWEQHVGRHRFEPLVARATDVWVVLARHAEGVVFGEQGAFTEIGYLDTLGQSADGSRFLPLPPGIRQEADRLFADRATLAETPVLPGPHVMFYGGTLSNYAHWMVDSMLQLHVMQPYLPPDATLLMPGTLRGFAASPTPICDHLDIMRAVGLGDLARVEIDAPFCRVEEVYWLENGSVHNMPAELMQGFRAHVASLRPPPARRDRRLYIARRGSRRVTNGADLQAYLLPRRFTVHYLEDLSADAQIDLFAEAEWVISPHGAELGNLLFCQPGTRLLELAPDDMFRHYFSYMTNKLGLVHGILPCPTDERGFFGDMTVDMDKFAALFRMLKCVL